MTTTNKREKTVTGAQVRRWRILRSLTQAQVADKLGITQQAYGHLEKGGASQIHALAFAAIDAGLPPWSPTDPEPEGDDT